MLTTTAVVADPAPTKMTAREGQNSNNNGSDCANSSKCEREGSRLGGEAARDRQQGPRGGREQFDEQRGKQRREGGVAEQGRPGGSTTGTATKSDQLSSASIAADRSGNGRGVDVSKRRVYIKRVFLP